MGLFMSENPPTRMRPTKFDIRGRYVNGFMRHKIVVKLERAGGADDKLGFLCSEDRKRRYDVLSKKKSGVTTENCQKWEVEYQVD
ncbi:hypothetical protein JMJ77_0014835 [Colletotrichum scovillei]|uniref:Uncharacterized protein n=1 Tax=Colletotrichum scovillei TaxID=1209932 RepID=A0A9P7QYZ9_9PEZI|nr:hypothetical protein JMJ77_0014835 [Colletotrichum scovillei]KAG7056449.1 hypothetical protein JMJ78_0000249 [Colletotrichum scovillei]KAG7066377.1 hypothetical protein JMJ76_0000240 [Colletotrichum scovillei]